MPRMLSVLSNSLICPPLLLAVGGVPDEVFYEQLAGFLTVYYLLLGSMNGLAALYLWQVKGASIAQSLFWLVVGAFFVILAPFAGTGNPALMPGLPQWMRDLVDNSTGPVIYTLGTTAALVVLFLFRKFFVKPQVAWAMLNIALLLMGLSMIDRDFYAIVAKPDNVPIVMLVFLLGFFTWLATSKAVENDERAKEGKPPREKELDEKILVWPDLVYTELICMIALTAGLILWGILLNAPLEEPASSVKTPNPSKAPWYFLGLQEMLVYYDPWMAGVVLPTLIIVGLMAIPYIDFNKKGNGYYTINERKFSYIVFQLGFLELWVTLIILGTFLRGPNWNFFGPFEYWDAHKVEALNNINLSEYFWILWLNQGLPNSILLRELPGIVLVLGYFLLLPPVLAVTVFRNFFVRMGLIRFMTMAMLLLFMLALPIKMVLRWSFNLKYLIYIPEIFLNF